MTGSGASCFQCLYNSKLIINWQIAHISFHADWKNKKYNQLIKFLKVSGRTARKTVLDSNTKRPKSRKGKRKMNLRRCIIFIKRLLTCTTVAWGNFIHELLDFVSSNNQPLGFKFLKTVCIIRFLEKYCCLFLTNCNMGEYILQYLSSQLSILVMRFPVCFLISACTSFPASTHINRTN